MEALVATLIFALLFGLFAVSRVAERTRPCQGRDASGERRCLNCPLRFSGDGEVGPCPGKDEARCSNGLASSSDPEGPEGPKVLSRPWEHQDVEEVAEGLEA